MIMPSRSGRSGVASTIEVILARLGRGRAASVWPLGSFTGRAAGGRGARQAVSYRAAAHGRGSAREAATQREAAQEVGEEGRTGRPRRAG